MGLQLSGSVQLEGNLLVTGSANSVFENISVTNRITANEINVQFVSSSIIYSSGSNKFGDEITDKHQFTGSLQVSGSTKLGNSSDDIHEFTGSVNVSGSINIISHGANGVVLNQDPSNAGVSSRLFFMNSLPSGMAIMNESGRMSFRSGSIPNGGSGTEVMSIQHNNLNLSSGNLVVASGQGIDFSATSNGSGTTTSELLNDYEEGTWTPTYTGTNITVTSYGSQGGYYTKVGRLVTVTFRIMTEDVTVIGSENVSIAGLPFAAANVTENSNAVNIFDNSRWTATPPVIGQINANQSTIVLHSNIGNTGAAQDPTPVLSSNMAIGAGNRNMVRATATYFTA